MLMNKRAADGSPGDQHATTRHFLAGARFDRRELS